MSSLVQSVISLFYAIFLAFGFVSMPSADLSDVPPVEAENVRIVSFNLRTTDDLHGSVKTRSVFIGETIKAYHPDSFGVQECNPKWISCLETQLGDEYARVGEARDKSKNSEYSCVYYRKEKYNLLDSGTIWLSKTPDVVGSKSFSSVYPRIATWATLQNKQTGEVYIHLNTHLDHILEKSRVGQAGVLLEKANELAQIAPIVITGDFNANESSKCYAKVTSEFNDCKYIAEISDEGMTFHDYGREQIRRSPIDFVFVQSGVKVSRYKIIDNMAGEMYLSDHYGLCADMKF